MNLYDSATDRYADLELLSDLVFERDNAELIPYRRVTVEEGSTLWVTLEKVGVPEAVVRTPEDTFTISEFVMDWVEGDLPLSPWLDARGARLQAEFADIGPWLREYDITGLSSGTSRFDIWAKGNLLTPDLWITAKMDRPAIVSQAPDASGRFRERFPAESMKTSMVLEEGTITFETLDIDLGDGHIRFARGDTMSALSAEPYEGDEDLITWWPKEVIPSKLSVEVDDVGLGRLEQNILREMGLMGTHASLQELLDKRGVRAFDGRLDGDILLFDDLYAPLLCVELEVTGGQIYVEPVPRAALSATVRSPGARSRCPGDDGTQPLAASRGTDTILHALRVEVPGASEPITMSGRVDGEGALGVTVDASRVKLSEVRTLQALMGAEPGTPGVRGELSAHLDVGGTTASPSLGGSARVLAMKVGTYALGDLALVMDTATREILTFDGPEQLSTIRVAGSLLPWLTLDVEVPLSDEEPRTAAIGFEGLDVLELARRTGLSEQIPGFALLARLQRATGSGEIILSSQGDRLDVRAEIPEARVHMPGLTLTNDEPLKLSYSSSVVDGEAVELVGVDHLSVGSGGDFVSVTGGGTLDAGVFYVDVAGAIDLEWIEPLREALPTLMPELVREATGKLALAGSVTTTASTGSVPQVDASMSFENASFVLVGYEEPLEVERGEVVVRNDRVLLGGDDVLRGTFLGGSFFASGALGLEQFAPKTMDLRLRTFNINYRVPDVASVTLDTDLRMTASDLDSFGTWGVSGSVDILDGLYTQNISVIEQQLTGRVLGAFDRSTELFEASTFEDYPELEDLTLDLDVRARDSFRIKNQIDRFGLDLELRMDLAISGTFGDPGVFGSVEVVDGLVGFQGEEFTMENGEIGFTGDLSNPRIDVVAGADIRNACATDVTQESTLTVVDLGSTGREDEEELYHVTLNVRGTPDKLDILYESDPFADQRDVLSLIFTGCTVDLLTASSASQPTLEIALGPLIGRLEREIQDVIKVEEFTIVPGVERAQVRISDSLTRRVSWKFELNTGFADRSDTQLGLLEFKFTDRWALQVSEQVLTGGTNATNQFNLNLNLNYRLPLD
ncbi:MAG: translocation/assembly module TamB domain-containing protein [Myxococcota bacterium]